MIIMAEFNEDVMNDRKVFFWVNFAKKSESERNKSDNPAARVSAF